MSISGAATPDQSQAEQILATARSGAPSGWFAWPLRRDRVVRSALEAAGIAIFGLVLFVPLALVTIPSNFQHGVGMAVATIILLGLVGAVAFGGLGLLIADLLRLAQADQYLLVMTPTDYVKAEPRRTTHVPMASVAYVTLRGVKLPGGGTAGGDAAAEADLPRGGGVASLIPFSGQRASRRMRSPSSLAFLDLRSDREVVVAMDNAFDELIVLREILTTYAGGPR